MWFVAPLAMTLACARASNVSQPKAVTTMTEVTVKRSQPTASDKAGIRAFHVNVPEAELNELRRRINATRWPERETVTDASQGVQLATMQKLAHYWVTEYDWRKCEAKLNALPQFVTEIDGVDIHFIHVRSKHQNALPLIITHGWPGSIIELMKIIDPLTNPTAHGASASDAFDLVIPSIAGYGFSGKPTTTGWDPAHMARAWGRADEAPWIHAIRGAGRRLGCDGFGADRQTGASGTAGYTPQHACYCPGRRCKGADGRRPAAIRSLCRRKARVRAAGLFLHARHRLRNRDAEPSTNDIRNRGFTRRPSGLDTRPRRAQLRVDLTRLRRTARRPYARRRPRQHHALLVDEHGDFFGSSLLGKQAPFFRRKERHDPRRRERLSDEIYAAPRTWTERAYPKLIYYNRVDRGGHFAAWEQPQLFSAEVRTGFRPLRH